MVFAGMTDFHRLFCEEHMPESKQVERWVIIHAARGGPNRNYRDEHGAVTPNRMLAAKFRTREAAVQFAQSADLTIGALDYPGLETFLPGEL